MKSPNPSQKTNESALNKDIGEQPVRLIKAAQANKLFHGSGHGTLTGAAEVQKKPEIRMIHSAADYCDLEITCGCGESTQVRCWNTPLAETKSAV
jgi:hypothetical protein